MYNGVKLRACQTRVHLSPNLKELAGSHGLDLEGCSVDFIDACTATDIMGWMELYKALKRGLAFCNLHITFSSSTTDGAEVISSKDAMRHMQPFPISNFIRCIEQSDSASWDPRCRLALVGTVFPELRAQELCGSLNAD